MSRNFSPYDRSNDERESDEARVEGTPLTAGLLLLLGVGQLHAGKLSLCGRRIHNQHFDKQIVFIN